MKLSIETYIPAKNFGVETALEMIKEAGFDAYDFSLYNEMKSLLDGDCMSTAKKIRAFADNLGLVCNQAHAPWGVIGDDEFSDKCEPYAAIVRSIEFASILGADNIIIHAVSRFPEGIVTSGERFYDYNRRFYKSFEPICRKCGIKVSVENLFAGNPDGGLLPVLGDAGEITEFVESLESDCFNICIDVGHSNITGYNPADVLSKVGSKHLRALHIHDNSGINDEHTLPYNGKIQWLAITDALSKIGYEGEFTFEVFSYLNKINPALMPSALKYICDIGRHLISEIQK